MSPEAVARAHPTLLRCEAGGLCFRCVLCESHACLHAVAGLRDGLRAAELPTTLPPTPRWLGAPRDGGLRTLLLERAALVPGTEDLAVEGRWYRVTATIEPSPESRLILVDVAPASRAAAGESWQLVRLIPTPDPWAVPVYARALPFGTLLQALPALGWN